MSPDKLTLQGYMEAFIRTDHAGAGKRGSVVRVTAATSLESRRKTKEFLPCEAKVEEYSVAR